MVRKRVLFTIPSLEEGGAERVLVNLLGKLDYNRFEVDLCVVENRGIFFNQIPEQVKLITVFNSSLVCKILVNFHIRFNINRLYKWIVNRRITGNYHVGISFLDSSFTDILFFLDNKITKRIAWVHSGYQTYHNFGKFYQGAYKDRIIQNRYSKLDHIVFVSNDSRQEFEGIFTCKTLKSVIYNVLDTEKICKLSDYPIDEKFDDSIINIIALGVLLPVKGYDLLINAALLLKNDDLKFKIRILGNGYLEHELLSQIESLDLEDFVELKGFHINPYPFLKQSDIFVMTSLSEGLPTALGEAMILGLPVVVTDCSGCRELVAEGQYGMMTDKTAEGIYHGLRTMINNSELREFYKQKSRERAEVFDDDAIMEKIYSVMDY